MSILWHITCLLLLRSCSPGFFIHGIVGGKVSILHSRPYMVYIRDKISKLTCDGFLVREDYVMTAASCKQSHLMVYLGVTDTNFLPDGIEVDPVPHPEFNMNRTGHDIMLLKLKTPATLNTAVGTITLPKTENEEIPKDCMVMGWGWKKFHDESPSNVLKEASVTLIDSENCGTADTLCTEGSTGPAQGDSGGPLVCGGVAEGIVFFNKNRSNAENLTAFTHISRYLSWIQSIMPLDMPEMLASVLHSRPYMVYIRDKVLKSTCGGFLVREDYVMTAAHCKQRHLMVYLGVSDTNFLPDGIEVDPFPHPEFNMKGAGHDIMLLKLKTPATMNKTVGTIAFPKPENEQIQKDCMVMGWGWQNYNDESPSNVLKEASVTLIDSENCGTPDTLCTKGTIGPAPGDSGGPLVCGGVAKGIVSFFKIKRNADPLTVYTHISRYLSWIQSIMPLDMPEMLVSVPHSRPYMVYIRDKVLKSTCGGFLVREDYVMTAASCKQSHLMVYLGVYDTNFLPDGIEVDTIPHPEFNMNRIGHDIMLLKLKTPATSKKIAVTITLPNPENEEISKDCMVMGWGWKNYHEKSPSNVLQEANVTLIDSENCGTADILCTEGSTGPALGDSGGPLVCGGVAQGIVSFSKNKTNANYLAGYTRISHYLPWIQSIMMSPTTQVSTSGTFVPTPDTETQNPSEVFCLLPET